MEITFNMDGFDFCLKHPFTCMVSGPTSCGKTNFVFRLLHSDLICPAPSKVLYFYGQYQPLFDKFKSTLGDRIVFIPGVPGSAESILKDHNLVNCTIPKLFVLDDIMLASAKDDNVAQLFMRGSHHLGISVLYLTQNLFNQGKQARNISLNCHYMVLFKNPRDNQQIQVLARQVYPQRPRVLTESFEDATVRPYGYLMLNLRPDINDKHRLLTNVLPGEGTTTVYVPNG
jgi:hypothetical protein